MPHELMTFFQTASPLDLIILGSLLAVWVVVLFHTLLFYFRLALYRLPSTPQAGTPISVIMVERNEEENLSKNLPGWASLAYPSYEILVVDDFSGDNSLSVVGLLKLNFPRIRLTGLNQETRYSQKLSRNLALKGAAFDEVVFVHPSMEMPPHQWLQGIASGFASGKKIVVGYVSTIPGKGFYHRMFRIESFFQQAESMGYCLNGLPFVVNEENVAFKKQAYFDISGFAGKIREEYLNLEMVFNDVIRRKENGILPFATFSLHREMKIRKTEFNDLLFKSFKIIGYLSFGKKLLLRFFDFIKIIYLPFFIVCFLIYPVWWPVFLSMLVIRFLFLAVSIKRIQNHLKEPKIFLPSLIYGVVSPYYKLGSRWRYNYRQKNS